MGQTRPDARRAGLLELADSGPTAGRSGVTKDELRNHLRELEVLTAGLTATGLSEIAASTRMVPISVEDRVEFGRALVLQGYSPERAAYMATTGILDDDGALQMLARHRIRYSKGAL